MDVNRIDELYETLHLAASLNATLVWPDDDSDAPGSDRWFALLDRADEIIGERHTMIPVSVRPETTRDDLVRMLYESGILTVEHG